MPPPWWRSLLASQPSQPSQPSVSGAWLFGHKSNWSETVRWCGVHAGSSTWVRMCDVDDFGEMFNRCDGNVFFRWNRSVEPAPLTRYHRLGPAMAGRKIYSRPGLWRWNLGLESTGHFCLISLYIGPRKFDSSLPMRALQSAHFVEGTFRNPNRKQCGKPNSKLVGGSSHLEKYESQWEGWSHIWNGK